MEALQTSNQSDSILESIRQALAKITWKHALILSVPLCIYLYPRPITIPLTSKFTTHTDHQPKQIILTTNPCLTFQTLKKIQVIKGPSPQYHHYREDELITIQLFISERKNTLFASHSAVQDIAAQETINLYTETLWNNFRLTKLENPHLKVVLIKATDEILQNFVLKFYKMSQKQSHKVAFLNDNKLCILRLNERVFSYEHLTTQFQLS